MGKALKVIAKLKRREGKSENQSQNREEEDEETEMAATAFKEPKIEQGEAESEANTSSTQIPDDKEALLEFMDQRAHSIQHLKDQISIFERKVSSFFCFCVPNSAIYPSFSCFDLGFNFDIIIGSFSFDSSYITLQMSSSCSRF